MNTYWKIEQLTRRASDGGVTAVHWRLFGEEDGFQATLYGEFRTNPDPSSPNFIPFADLTEAEVINWITSTMREGRMNDFIADLAVQIEQQKNPMISDGLPWA